MKLRRIVQGCVILSILHMILAFALDQYGHEPRSLQPADVIVVLGAGVHRDGYAGPSLRARVEQGAALYRRRLAPKLLITGGLGEFAPTESAAGTAVALALGVSQTDILQENQARSTAENAEFSRPILLAARARRLIVVSDARHLWRGQRNFAAQGFDVQISAAYNYENTWKYGWRGLTALAEAISVERDFFALRYFGDPLPIDAH